MRAHDGFLEEFIPDKCAEVQITLWLFFELRAWFGGGESVQEMGNALQTAHSKAGFQLKGKCRASPFLKHVFAPNPLPLPTEVFFRTLRFRGKKTCRADICLATELQLICDVLLLLSLRVCPPRAAAPTQACFPRCAPLPRELPGVTVIGASCWQSAHGAGGPRHSRNPNLRGGAGKAHGEASHQLCPVPSQSSPKIGPSPASCFHESPLCTGRCARPGNAAASPPDRLPTCRELVSSRQTRNSSKSDI